MRARVAPAVTVAAAVAGLLGASPAGAETVRATSGPLTATFTAGTHRPTCKQLWPVRVTARLNGKPARAVAQYQFMSGGYQVSIQNPFSATPKNRRNRPWHFRGSFYDDGFGPFGSLAVGQHLVVRAIVKAAGYTAYTAYDVTVRKVRGCKVIR
jgi:hypothetical protein